jgi:hypothetical protein
MNNFAASNKSGLVQSHSVTAQFNALSVDLENFRNAKQVAQGNHGKVHDSLRQLKKEQTTLLTQIRMEQEGLGTLSRKRDMFGNEKARLKGVMDRERKALEACVKHSKGLSDKGDEATLQYANEMAEASNEVTGYLQHETHAKKVAFLSVEAVQAVVTPKVPGEPQVQQSFYQGFQIMRNGKGSLHKEVARHHLLRSKYDDQPAGSLVPVGPRGTGDVGLGLAGVYAGNRQQQMDLFYGLSNGGADAEMAHA